MKRDLKIVVALLALGPLLMPCGERAMAQDAGFETDNKQVTANGPVYLLSGWKCWFANCAQANCHMETTTKPLHGSLRAQFKSTMDAGGQCYGHPMNGLFVTYTPRSGFSGEDRVVFRSVADNGGRHILTFDITVPPR